jgi:peptidoglycan/xylan/chitin deacetylase (PgdA/CDA1 family)
MNPRSRKMKLLGLLPRSWVLTRASPARRVLYLTFDDGPHPSHTPALLDLLAQHGARASFFAIGNQAEEHPHLVRRIVDEGHLLGNHSHTHPQFDVLAFPQQVDEVARADDVLASFDGRTRHLFRPPRGEMSLRMLWFQMRRRLPITCWSYDSHDYARYPPGELIAMAQRHPPRPGDVILMHDDAALSHEFLRAMLPMWKEAGYVFEALPAHA